MTNQTSHIPGYSPNGFMTRFQQNVLKNSDAKRAAQDSVLKAELYLHAISRKMHESPKKARAIYLYACQENIWTPEKTTKINDTCAKIGENIRTILSDPDEDLRETVNFEYFKCKDVRKLEKEGFFY